ncbi:MAG TPA: hypothetical protein VJP77_04275 [Planctomycetota bacterium]|nr:hypothetical protein [Planctomycetota bacterium]
MSVASDAARDQTGDQAGDATADALWISRRGELACARHAAYANDHKGWRPLDAALAEEIEEELGREPSCEACDAIEQHEEWRASRGA